VDVIRSLEGWRNKFIKEDRQAPLHYIKEAKSHLFDFGKKASLYLSNSCNDVE
jgi:nitrate reductase assembly molybdenum cofactor insertion protein NarJ